MANKVAAAALQYSKWLSRFICWVWAIYRFAALFGSVIRPEASASLASTLVNLDWIMLVNEGTYLINSLGEKYIYSDRFVFKWLEKGGFKALLARVSAINEKKANELAEEVGEEDGDDQNG